MSPDAITETHIPSASASSPDLDHSFSADLHLQYPGSNASDSPSPHDASQDHERNPSEPHNLKLIPSSFPAMAPQLYSPSSADTEYFSQDIYLSSPIDGQNQSQESVVFSSPTFGLVPFPSSASDTSSPEPATAHTLSTMPSGPTPEPDYHFPPSASHADPSSTARPRDRSICDAQETARRQSGSRAGIAHPYARLYTRREGTKRRKMWNHALEKALFTPQEISTMGAPQRRTIYTASLEAHVDRLHEQLLSLELFPVPFQTLECFKGLNSKTAKSMVAGLHRDACELRLKRLELDRAHRALRDLLNTQQHKHAALPQNANSTIGLRRHSLNSAV